MSSREIILARVRAKLGRGDAAGRRVRAEAALAAPLRGPQPVVGDDPAGRFCAKASALASTVERVPAAADVPAAVTRYLDAAGLGRCAVGAADLATFDWAAAGLAVAWRGAVDADTVGLTGSFCAIAETGTLVLLSGPRTPASLSLLPETHVAVVFADRIVATLEDAFALLRREEGEIPRSLNLISGPSRTGDIEQTIVLGAHGPRRVHLVVVG